MIRRLLSRLFANDLTGYVPRIVELDVPITIIGMSVDTTLKSIYRDVPRLGKQFKELKEANPILNSKEPWAFAAVSRGYDPATGAMTYMMGDVVTNAAEAPEGMSAFEIPAITYAIFPVRPRTQRGWGMAIANAKGYAYTVWLPKSGYEPSGEIDDFEYHDERSTLERSPEIDLYVAIKRKAG